MKICFTSDFHGSPAHYAQLDQLLSGDAPDVLILGGDMLADGEFDDPIGTQVAYINDDFLPRIDRWRRSHPGMAVACILGNHDWACTAAELERHHEQGRIVMLSPKRHWLHDGVAFLGYSCTPPTPYWVKDFERLDLPDDPLPETGGVVWQSAENRARQTEPADHYHAHAPLTAELAEIATPDQPWIFVCHAPPHDTNLDRLPNVTYPVGSRAVRRFVEQRRPLCALHGHIHESPEVTGNYSDHLGRVLCVNPGQGAERLHAILFDTADPAGTLRHTVFG